MRDSRNNALSDAFAHANELLRTRYAYRARVTSMKRCSRTPAQLPDASTLDLLTLLLPLVSSQCSASSYCDNPDRIVNR